MEPDTHPDFDNNDWPIENLNYVDQVLRAGRRPLLHLVVIYASNQKVMEYAQKTIEVFLRGGIDTYVQTTSPIINNKTTTRDIESQHLAEIITSSRADFLIVTGQNSKIIFPLNDCR